MADKVGLPLARLHLTYDVAGVLRRVAVVVDGEEVAQLPVHRATMAVEGNKLGEYTVALHADHVRVENGPTCGALSEAGATCTYEAPHGDPHSWDRPRAPGYEGIDRTRIGTRIRHA